jgi:hypothetical protein
MRIAYQRAARAKRPYNSGVRMASRTHRELTPAASRTGITRRNIARIAHQQREEESAMAKISGKHQRQWRAAAAKRWWRWRHHNRKRGEISA